MSDSIKTISNAFAIIDQVQVYQPIGVSQISNNLDLPKTTTHRIIKTLINLNVLSQDENENYSLGLKLFDYHKGIHPNNHLIKKVKPHLEALAKSIGESTNLGVFHHDTVQTLDSVAGEYYTLQPILSPNFDLYCSGMGKLFLSEFTDAELESYFSIPRPERTINTITTYKDFLLEKSKIEKEIISFDDEEFEYGLSCFAVPLRNTKNELVAAISISGPTTRLQMKGTDKIKAELIETAHKIVIS